MTECCARRAMRLSLLLAFVLPTVVSGAEGAAPSVEWVPPDLPAAPATGPALCPGAYLTPEQGKAALDATLVRFPNREAWQAYADHVRQRIQEGIGLAPWPRRTPLHTIVRARRTFDGYTVENVAIESVPGYFVTGNLYRPRGGQAPYPVVLATHGHARPIVAPEDYDNHGRFDPSTQARAGALARMGAVVLSIDMFGNGDSIQQVTQEAHRQPFSMTIQAWNAMRALDFLLSLPDIDPKRVAVSGASGGGTQAFILTALDSRVTVSVPVVMVSAHFFGGCPCESGLPIHRSADHFASNPIIAALAAPRPMLVISDGKDWTANTPTVEYPFLQKVYSYYGATEHVRNVHLADEGHDYGPSKRAATYRFLAEQFGLDLGAVQDASGTIDESRVTIERAGPMHVFDAEHPLPARALHDAAAVERALRALQVGRYADVNGLHMYYEVHGFGGTPLVLLHGGGSTIETSFGRLLPALAKKRQVIALEQQGHGHTADVDRPFGFEQSADDTAALLRYLKVESADLFGFSNGGSIALQVAIRHPSLVHKLVTASAMFKRDGMYPWFWESMQHAVLEDMPAELKEAYRATAPHPERLQSFHDKSVRRMLDFRDWRAEDLHAIAAPTLILIGDQDVVRPEHAVEMFRLLPHGRLAVLPGTDHAAMMLRADWLVSMVEAFLDEPMP